MQSLKILHFGALFRFILHTSALFVTYVNEEIYKACLCQISSYLGNYLRSYYKITALANIIIYVYDVYAFL